MSMLQFSGRFYSITVNHNEWTYIHSAYKHGIVRIGWFCWFEYQRSKWKDYKDYSGRFCKQSIFSLVHLCRRFNGRFYSNSTANLNGWTYFHSACKIVIVRIGWLCWRSKWKDYSGRFYSNTVNHNGLTYFHSTCKIGIVRIDWFCWFEYGRTTGQFYSNTVKHNGLTYFHSQREAFWAISYSGRFYSNTLNHNGLTYFHSTWKIGIVIIGWVGLQWAVL